MSDAATRAFYIYSDDVTLEITKREFMRFAIEMEKVTGNDYGQAVILAMSQIRTHKVAA